MNNMSIGFSKKIKEEWLSDAYASVQQGTEVRGCKHCRCFRQEMQGEQNQSPCKLGVKRTARGLEYNCFKASCLLGGGTINDGNTQFGRLSDVRVHATDKPSPSGRVSQEHGFPQDCVAGATEHRLDWLSQFSIGAVDIARYGIAERQSDRNGVYFPLNDITGRYQGYLRRDVSQRTSSSGEQSAGAKWIAHVPPAQIYLSRCFTGDLNVFLVEDAVSCIRVGKNHFTAALLGTYLRKEQLPAIIAMFSKVKPKRVFIALDPDAYDKAKIIEKVLTNYWTGVKAIQTTKDPKWWTDQELKEIVR